MTVKSRPNNAECQYAECHHAECRGAFFQPEPVQGRKQGAEGGRLEVGGDGARSGRDGNEPGRKSFRDSASANPKELSLEVSILQNFLFSYVDNRVK